MKTIAILFSFLVLGVSYAQATDYSGVYRFEDGTRKGQVIIQKLAPNAYKLLEFVTNDPSWKNGSCTVLSEQILVVENGKTKVSKGADVNIEMEFIVKATEHTYDASLKIKANARTQHYFCGVNGLLGSEFTQLKE